MVPAKRSLSYFIFYYYLLKKFENGVFLRFAPERATIYVLLHFMYCSHYSNQGTYSKPKNTTTPQEGAEEHICSASAVAIQLQQYTFSRYIQLRPTSEQVTKGQHIHQSVRSQLFSFGIFNFFFAKGQQISKQKQTHEFVFLS